MNPVFVIVWLFALAIVVTLRRRSLRGSRLGYLYTAYGLGAVFIAALVVLSPGRAMYALAVIAAIGLPIGLLVDRRRHRTHFSKSAVVARAVN
jgi:uncharacterized membrane protein